MRSPVLTFVAIVTALSTAAAGSPDYAKGIVGPWRYHTAQRADRIVIFHPDGSWGVRNWDFSQPEDIRGRRWRISGDTLVITPPPADSGQPFAERIVSFTPQRFVTEIDSRRVYYTRIRHWPPKSPNQAMQLTAPRSVSPSTVATTLSSQPRAVSGAVADLVSR